MSKTSRKPIERIEQILQGLLSHLKKNPDQETFLIPLKEFSAWGILLQDRDGLEIAFAKINSETPAISFNFEKIESGRMLTASDGMVSTGHEVVKIHVEDIEGVEEYLNQFKNITISQDKSITKLAIVKADNERNMLVVINEDYSHPFEAEGDYWEKLFSMVQKKGISKSGNKGFKDYFNSNTQCQLYSQTGYSLTKIVTTKGGMLEANIPIEPIDNRTFNRRKNLA